ncbi:glycosyltransferase [Rhodopseudomonas sp. HC1]|uniref:glycosyltransferase family 2 protein n=1 Tax=Rhodopseudomonas infernalis TaxID=2897386 RepID=UPI001EE99835|nr:glycosyltransferase [Rhodopseudomonas infernalis]MCG6205223.1 glycosyltransferase [Rhodopseudomonas infernalis]
MLHDRAKANEAKAGLLVRFAQTGPTSFAGYVVNEDDLALRYVIDVLGDGVPLALVRCTMRSDELVAAGTGDGCYGFSVEFGPEALGRFQFLEARIANTGIPLGQAIPIVRAELDSESARGEVKWLGELRIAGWLAGSRGTDHLVTARLDGQIVHQSRALQWAHLGSGREMGSAVPRFDFHLPQHLADGRARTLQVVDGAGNELKGSPLRFVAYGDTLEELTATFSDVSAERLRTEQFRRLFPRSLPFSAYPQIHTALDEQFKCSAKAAVPPIVAIVGDDNCEDTLESLRLTADQWTAGVISLNERGEFSGDFVDFLDSEAEADCVVFVRSGLEFAPGALQRLVSAYCEAPDAAFAYADLIVTASDGCARLIAFTSFDYERLVEQGYCAHLFVTSRQRAIELLRRGAATNIYDLLLALANSPTQANVVHAPGGAGVLPPLDIEAEETRLLAAAVRHFSERKVAAEFRPAGGSMFPSVRVSRRPEDGTTTIVIPTRNQARLLEKCLKSIRGAVRRARAKIVVADNDTTDADTLNLFDRIAADGVSVIRIPGYFNYADIMNRAVGQLDCDRVCLLNNDILALDDDWLDEMTGRLAEPDVGAVGALLSLPSGVTQHAGIVLGPKQSAVHVGTERLFGDPGYSDMLRVARQTSAVTAACLVTRTSDYFAVGGFDSAFFPIDYNDVDYCLKLRALGKRIVVTPHARLLHLESASRGPVDGETPQFKLSLQRLRDRWIDALADDPYYNPLLALDETPFTALACPPRNLEPRRLHHPRMVEIAVAS